MSRKQINTVDNKNISEVDDKRIDDANNWKATIQFLRLKKARTVPKWYSINPNLIQADLDSIKKACRAASFKL